MLCLLPAVGTGCDSNDATVASSSDAATSSDTTATPPGATWTPASTGHTVTENATYKWKIPATAPTRNADCTSTIDASTSANAVPWKGFEYDGTVYSCNTCPQGRELVQGAWRALYDRVNSDPAVAYDKDPTAKETMTFAGNQFQMHIFGQDLNAAVDATVEGWYWCGDQPEVPNKAVFFVLTKVSPEGAFGWNTGFVFTADVLANSKGMAFGWYDKVVTSAGSSYGGDQEYCPIGGVSADDIACTDPFAK